MKLAEHFRKIKSLCTEYDGSNSKWTLALRWMLPRTSHPATFTFTPLLPPRRTRHFTTFPLIRCCWERERRKETEKLVCVHNEQSWTLRNFFPSLFRSLRPHGLIEERAHWPCAGRRGSMPTKRKRTMNNQLPSTQEASLVLGFPRNQEINTSKHFNRIFIKVQTNSAILMQTRSCNVRWWKIKWKKEVHPSNTNSRESKEKGFFFFVTQRIPWVWTTVDPKGQRSYKQIDMVATGRTKTSQSGWWGQQW